MREKIVYIQRSPAKITNSTLAKQFNERGRKREFCKLDNDDGGKNEYQESS